jgi:hypothetical protein
MSLLQEMETHGLADCEFNRKLINCTLVVRAYNQFGEWMDDIGYFETKESAEMCLLQAKEGDSGDEDSWNYHIEEYTTEAI